MTIKGRYICIHHFQLRNLNSISILFSFDIVIIITVINGMIFSLFFVNGSLLSG
jgi:hypothetical protein